MPFVFRFKDASVLFQAWERYFAFCTERLFWPGHMGGEVEDLLEIYDNFTSKYTRIVYVETVKDHFDPVRSQILKALLMKMEVPEVQLLLANSNRRAIEDLKKAMDSNEQLTHEIAAVNDDEKCGFCSAECEVLFCTCCRQSRCRSCLDLYCISAVNDLVKTFPFDIPCGKANTEHVVLAEKYFE